MQVLMMRLGAQALDLMLACAEGRLAEAAVNWADDHALTVVMAARAIRAPTERAASSAAWTACPRTAATWFSTPAPVTARGDSLKAARDAAYAMVAAIDWPEGFCRSDIGWRAL
jgi:phosphoribosylamine--glycine ligase